MRYEMRFSGSGGQGVILASVIVAEAAVAAGLEAVQSQAYGPEARGGLCRAETILSREKIWYTKVIRPSFLLALTQDSLDKYAQNLAPDAMVGKAMTANIVAVGAVNKALGLFDEAALTEGVRRHIPAGTEELNWKALAEGAALVTDEQAALFRRSL